MEHLLEYVFTYVLIPAFIGLVAFMIFMTCIAVIKALFDLTNLVIKSIKHRKFNK